MMGSSLTSPEVMVFARWMAIVSSCARDLRRAEFPLFSTRPHRLQALSNKIHPAVFCPAPPGNMGISNPVCVGRGDSHGRNRECPRAGTEGLRERICGGFGYRGTTEGAAWAAGCNHGLRRLNFTCGACRGLSQVRHRSRRTPRGCAGRVASRAEPWVQCVGWRGFLSGRWD